MKTQPLNAVLDYAGVIGLYNKLKMTGIKTVISSIASGFMIFGGVIPYIPQYREIRATQNAEGFSLYVCLTLLTANTLRVFFWFGHPFELPLLIQSAVMIFTMFVMIQLCTSVKRNNEIIAGKNKRLQDSDASEPVDKPSLEKKEDIEISESDLLPKIKHKFFDFDWNYFWQWTDFSSYIQFMLLFACIIGLVTWLFLNVPVYVETLGFLAVLFEALLGAPQFYRNFQNQSTKGMSVSMVLLWTAGDIFKTIYFIARLAPVQFWVCGILQVSLDFAIMLQVGYYSS